jgi:GMP synthase (glutamine-hydrolysing)
VRENKVFSKIVPYNISAKEIAGLSPKGLILSGGPASVVAKKSPYPDKRIFKLGLPILGICYGMQVIAEMMEGRVRNYSLMITGIYSAAFRVILPVGQATAII